MHVFTRLAILLPPFVHYHSGSVLQISNMAKKTEKKLYDPLYLIELAKQRPCNWDKTADEHKDTSKIHSVDGSV